MTDERDEAPEPVKPDPALSALARKRIDRAMVQVVCALPFESTILMRLIQVEDWSAPTMWTDGRRLGYSPKFVCDLAADKDEKELTGVLAHEADHVADLHMLRRGTREPLRWNIACDQKVNALVKEAGLTLPKNCGEVRDMKGPTGRTLTPQEKEQAIGEAKQLVAQAAQAAKRAGKLTAGQARLVGELMKSRVPWRELLARFVSSHHREDYNWARPARKHLGRGFILPGLWSERMSPVVMACDTSGSIDPVTLTQVASEMLACLEMYESMGDAELQVLWCDAEVYPELVSDPSKIVPKGGGGTSFAPVFDWMHKHGEDAQGIVYVTDGYCSDFGERPACDVLWVLTAQNDGFKPPFGEVAHVIDA